tara:strand:+ start:208 stop:639 length:432 start_codon:yes stop_codon:yes gene_type:complete
MAKAYTGRDGSLQLSDVDQVKVKSWSLSASMDLLDTTTLSESVKSYTPGVQTFSGQASLLYYKQDDGSNDASALLRKLVKTGTDGVASTDTVSLTLRLADGTSYSDVKLTAYITGAQIGVATGDIVSTDITFQATGALPIATL